MYITVDVFLEPVAEAVNDSIARRLQDVGAFDLVMRARNAKAFTKGCPAVWALEMGCDPSGMHHLIGVFQGRKG